MEHMKHELCKKIMAHDFCCFDLRLYINTHPDDKNALELLKTKLAESARLHAEYAEKFGAMTYAEPMREGHPEESWPWETRRA